MPPASLRQPGCQAGAGVGPDLSGKLGCKGHMPQQLRPRVCSALAAPSASSWALHACLPVIDTLRACPQLCAPFLPTLYSAQCIIMGFAVGTLFLQQGRDTVFDAQVRCRTLLLALRCVSLCVCVCTCAAALCVTAAHIHGRDWTAQWHCSVARPNLLPQVWCPQSADQQPATPRLLRPLCLQMYMSVLFFSVMTQLVVSFAAPGLLIERLPVYLRQRNAHFYPGW